MQNKLEIGEIKSPEDVLLLCGKKTELLKMVLEVTKEQPEAYSAGQDEIALKLMENIEARQLLIDMLSEIEARLEEAKKLGIPFSPESEGLQQASQEVLLEIVSQDKLNESLATGRLNELRQELKRLNTSQQSRNAYDPVKPGYVSSVYFDRQN